jgi:hypothetical protein
MSMDDFTSPADLLAEDCHREHTDRRDPDCTSCDQRAEIQHCAQCGASYEDGRWFTALGSTAPNGCDHEALVDDWDNEIRCPVMATMITRIPGFEGVRQQCGAPVTTPGCTACAHHQRWLDQEECGRVYQRMVRSLPYRALVA